MYIQLELPYPPSVNHYWGQSGKQRFIGKKGKEFRARVMNEVTEAGVQPLEGRLSIHVALYPPDRRKRDLDNVLKSLLDACEHAGCYENDSQIDEIRIVRQEVKKNGACNIVILTID
jgi:crossover junction endodeoxyribonuclease RusA